MKKVLSVIIVTIILTLSVAIPSFAVTPKDFDEFYFAMSQPIVSDTSAYVEVYFLSGGVERCMVMRFDYHTIANGQIVLQVNQDAIYVYLTSEGVISWWNQFAPSGSSNWGNVLVYGSEQSVYQGFEQIYGFRAYGFGNVIDTVGFSNSMGLWTTTYSTDAIIVDKTTDIVNELHLQTQELNELVYQCVLIGGYTDEVERKLDVMHQDLNRLITEQHTSNTWLSQIKSACDSIIELIRGDEDAQPDNTSEAQAIAQQDQQEADVRTMSASGVTTARNYIGSVSSSRVLGGMGAVAYVLHGFLGDDMGALTDLFTFAFVVGLVAFILGLGHLVGGITRVSASGVGDHHHTISGFRGD